MRYRRVVIEGATYFFTVVTHQRKPLFGGAGAVPLLESAIAKIRLRWPFEIDAQVILPDHLHAIWSLPEADANYATRWRLIKEEFTREFLKRNAARDRTEASRARGEQLIWQRRFWEHTIRDETDFARHLDYVHLNPVHHGLAPAPRDWPHSTFKSWVDKGFYDLSWGSNQVPELPDWARPFE